ncbi:MAG: M48 family metallopeptidase [Bacteroidetes bacterium]|nr:M48 family metallopeptidase [Bacteroidota bacterium]
MNSQTLFLIIIGVIIADYLLEQFLDYLNSTCWSNDLPAELNGIYDVEKYRKSQNYARAKQKLSIIISTISFIAIIALLYWEGFAYLDKLLRSYSNNAIIIAILFFGVIGFLADILSMPFSLYRTFIIEEKYRFNKTSVQTFIIDKLKGWLLTIILGGGLLALTVWIYTITGQWFWLICWGVIGVLTVLMSMFYSSMIVPLFNKQSPLSEGELRDEIEVFAKKAGFKLHNIYVIDGSKRSTKANAYFSGFGPKKRIVLFDTLIEEHSIQELVAILAHEIGHYKKKHSLIGMGTSLAQTGIMLFLLSLFIDNPILSASLGSVNSSFHLGVIAFGILYSPISLILGLFVNYVMRKNEYAADRYAKSYQLADSLQLALKKLSVNSLSNLRPHHVYVLFYYSHPPLLERLSALKEN